MNSTNVPNVKIIAHTPDPEKIIGMAAKLCYSKVTIDELADKDYSSFIKQLIDIGHESPFEHASFTFAIENVSRTLLAQLTRHRIASFSVQSQRYVDLKDSFEYIVPESIQNEETLKTYTEVMDTAHESYVKLTEIFEEAEINKLLEKYDGVISEEEMKLYKMKANKKAIEDARFVLPNACTTKIIMTMNVRSLYNFFKLRCCNRAQWEIRKLAIKMYKLVYQISPSLFMNAGPSCTNFKTGCTEGKMSCGKQKEVRDIFLDIQNS